MLSDLTNVQVIVNSAGESHGAAPLSDWSEKAGIEQTVLVPLGNAAAGGVLLLCHVRTHSFGEQETKSLELSSRLLDATLAAGQRNEDEVAEVGSRDRFISALSHELRTPLTSIIGFTQIIRKRIINSPEKDARLLEQVDVLWSQAHRLSRLIDTFVDISHVESGEFAINIAKVELCSLVRRAIDQAQAQARSTHSIAFEEPEQEISVHGDAKRLDQVFNHVLSNAIRFSPQDKVITVRCAELVGQSKAVVSVTDNGPGIPPSRVREIFERFSQHEPLRSGGLGVGLYISKTIVEAHGGSINLESSPQAGTTIYITLPL